ncbi:MAG: JAB domain-containing protein [Candidatus Humimicrobiaceae bacterium]
MRKTQSLIRKTLNLAVCLTLEVFKAAILANSTSVVFLHGPPLEGTEPSNDDMEITSRLCKAGAILGINILDHLIITSNDYFSFREKGLL